MLNKEDVLWWNEVEKDIYEENGHIFGVELDLFNNHKYFYCKTVDEDGREWYQYLDGDIYAAIEQFNTITKRVKDMNHWIDNADSYICPTCGIETDNPNRYEFAICPQCGFQDSKDVNNN